MNTATATAIGSSGVGCVVGAEQLSEASGVWVKTHFYQDGDFLCATVYSVAAGEPKIIDLRVDLRPIARSLMRMQTQLRAAELAKTAETNPPLVGWSIGKMWSGVKKTAQKIGRLKLVKSVVSVSKSIAKGAKAVVKSKAFGGILAVAAVFPLTAPFAAPALGAYAAANATLHSVEIGAKVVKTAQHVSSTLSQGKRLAQSVALTKKKTSVAISQASNGWSAELKKSVQAKVVAASKITLNDKGKATVATALARTPAGPARAQVAHLMASRLKALAEVRKRTVLAKSLPPAAGAAVAASTRLELRAAPVLARAAALQKKVSNPAVKSKLTELRKQASLAENLLEGVKANAVTGDLDSHKSAVIVDLVARNRARIQGMSQANAGGLPGIVITPQGKLIKGRFRVEAKAGGQSLLYQGPDATRERGAFTSVVSGLIVGALESGSTHDLPIGGVRLSGCGGKCGCAPCRENSAAQDNSAAAS